MDLPDDVLPGRFDFSQALRVLVNLLANAAKYAPAGTPPDVRGTGLGLSIARGLAEAHGGAVRYEPRVGGGSAFVLPAADAIPLEEPAPAAPPPNDSHAAR